MPYRSRNGNLITGVRTYTIKKALDCKAMRTQKQINEYLEWKASYAPTAFKVYRVYIERFATFVGRKVVDEITFLLLLPETVLHPLV